MDFIRLADMAERLSPPCRSVPAEMMFPERGNTLAAKQAKKVCGDCPMIAECLQVALDENITHGIWGGTTEGERRRIRRDRRTA